MALIDGQLYFAPGVLMRDLRFDDQDRKSTRLNSSHTEIYTLSLHDALPILVAKPEILRFDGHGVNRRSALFCAWGPYEGSPIRRSRSEEHTSELQSHRDLHSFPTRRSSDLSCQTRDTEVRRSWR